MDADLQDPPSAGLELVRRVQAGVDVAYGVRRNRKEGPAKRMAYWSFYRLLKASSSIEIPMDAGDFAAMSRRVVNHINALPEHERFVRGLRSYVGFTQEPVEYDRKARVAGEPKYDFGRLVRPGLPVDCLGFSDAPLKLGFVVAGLFMASSVGDADNGDRAHCHWRCFSSMVACRPLGFRNRIDIGDSRFHRCVCIQDSHRIDAPTQLHRFRTIWYWRRGCNQRRLPHLPRESLRHTLSVDMSGLKTRTKKT